MDNLKGKNILIGKEPGQGRLLIAIAGTEKKAFIGNPGSVPSCVSRCIPAEGVAHCKITIGTDGSLTITNLKPQNVTYVDGTEIVSKRISVTSQVSLGVDRYRLNINTIMQVVQKLFTKSTQAAPPAKEYTIQHLEKIWDDYHSKNIEIAKQRNSNALMTRIPMIFTMGGGALAAVAKSMNWGDGAFTLTLLMSIIGFVVLIYGLWKSYSDNSIEEQEEIKEEFEQYYVCPNPACRHFLGYKKYSLLAQDRACPYCKSKFKS